MSTRYLTIVAAALIAAGGTSFTPLGAQENATPARVEPPASYTISRTNAAIVVDARLDDEGWREIIPIPLLLETSPADNQPPPVRTDAYLTYDDSKLYIAIRAWDPNPNAIRANLTDRDRAFQDDFAGVVLDTFNDGRRGFEFFVNPLGVQMDLFMNDVGGGEDESWDAIWESAGRIDDEGYIVEMAIPFTALRFKASKGPQTWGIDIIRVYPRSFRHRIGLNRLERGRNCYVCTFAKLTGFEGITPGRNLELDPTVTVQRTDANRSFPDGRLTRGSVETEPGLSASWGVTPNITLNAALNPDFSQVEADSPQLDVNRQFALFFEEKRPFFLEGADFFQTPLSIVYTRTVADPDWGMKVSGKEGKNALGVFVTRDSVTNLLIPGSQSSTFASIEDEHIAGVVRYRYDIASNSAIGLLGTARHGNDYSNTVGGFDAFFRLARQDTITAQFLRSRTEYPDSVSTSLGQPSEAFDDDALRLQYRHNSRHWFWQAFYEDIGEGFRADSGFLPQVDYRRGLAGLERTWWSDRSLEKPRWYTRFFWGGDWDRTETQEGELLEEELESWFGLAGPKQSFFFIDVGTRERRSGANLFDENFLGLFFEMRPAATLYVNVNAAFGDQIDFANSRLGERVHITPFVRWNIGRQTQIEWRHTYETLDVEGGRLYTANLTQLRAVYQFSVRAFIRTIIQYTDIDRATGLYTFEIPAKTERLFPQILFSYKLNPQTVLFVGYTENRVGDESIDLARRDRTFFTKVGYAWLF